MWGCVRVQFSCWQPVNNHPVKLTVNTHAFETSLTSQATSVRAKKKKKAHEFKWKAFKMSNDRKTVWVCLMLRNVKVKSWPGSLHITDRNTCLGSRNPTKQNVLFFFSFSLLPLEVTFTLAANETKQRRVIKADVFIQGFYRKLISWGMQSCARLIGGKLTFLKGKQAASVKSYRICIYIHGLRCVRHKSFDSNSSHHRFFFFIQTLKKARMWSYSVNHKVSKWTLAGYLSCCNSHFDAKKNNIDWLELLESHCYMCPLKNLIPQSMS